MSNDVFIVATVLAGLFVVAVFTLFLFNKITNLESSSNMRLDHLRGMSNAQYSRLEQLERELRALERYLDVQYISLNRRHGKMVKAKGETE